MAFTYDNPFGRENVYGHSVDLLRRLVSTSAPGAVHLDVGCGFGAIAPSIRAMGLHYVGVDLDTDGLERLKEQGFEAHKLELTNADETHRALNAVLAGRRLASITILDTLEHVLSPLDVMRALRKLASQDSVPIIISVPNITHTEIAVRMVTGKFDYTLDGVLDHTHIVNFSPSTLHRMARQAGLVEVEAFDTKVVEAYRNMHQDKNALSLCTSFYSLVSYIRGNADETATSYQLVRAFVPGPAHEDNPWFVEPSKQPDRPFLTIVIRTIGTETFTLRDTLACLAGQSCLDFDVLLMGHKLDRQRQIAVEEVLQDQPDFLRQRINFALVNEGGRSRPLNVAYKTANGRYIVTLDDDDLVFGNYVETFRKMYDAKPGRLLRARCGVQTARKSYVDGGGPAAISTGPVEPKYPADFNLLDHLRDNFTPCMSVAYPREVVHNFGQEFDESLSTAEDWDFMMRSYFLVGIATSPEITSIYRRWEDKPTSAQAHAQEEWLTNRSIIIQKHDALPVILSAGTLKELRSFYEAALTQGFAVSAEPQSATISRLHTRIRRKLGRIKARLLQI
ncbi:methyltransferase domain-containing protein [Rhizobium sp. BK661]|uniref:methyltransferase domain-containing protein n=1 Tax=Rhizobium sp. BK661 TaxID=2586991 RepID=UPI002168668B|nr:methyltransferase domain-containing protein [Rhizobium sp. BK661]MCS3744338.1 2-polyprenyl-3-methyl-5-hydroxy-6-metoxy-1,4-benzoquinol methylase [Rhizobium sp. BK661]